MSKTIFLIDFENVHEAGLQGLENCNGDCSVHLFYSQNANKLSLDLLRGLKAAFFVHKVQPGRQSLDMQLVSYLGYLIGTEGTDCRYVIVSKDTDFTNTPLFWQTEAGIDVIRQSSVAGGELAAPAKAARSGRGRRTVSRRTVPAVPAEGPQSSGPAETDVPVPPSEAEAPEAPPAEPVPAESEEAPAAAETETAAEDAPAVSAEPVNESLPAEEPQAEPAKTPRKRSSRRSKSSSAQQKTAAQPKPVQKAEAPARPAPAQPDPKTRLNNRLMQTLSENQVDNATTMKAVGITIAQFGNKNIKQLTYRAMSKEFGQKRGLELYNLIKPVLDADARQK